MPKSWVMTCKLDAFSIECLHSLTYCCKHRSSPYAYSYYLLPPAYHLLTITYHLLNGIDELGGKARKARKPSSLVETQSSSCSRTREGLPRLGLQMLTECSSNAHCSLTKIERGENVTKTLLMRLC